MTLGDYDVFDDPYCYKGTYCLKNRLGIRDPKRLAAFELEMSSLRADEPLPLGRFGPAHYRRIHWHLFHDVYRWAGKYRTVRTAKGGNWFCFPEHISRSMEALFERLTGATFLPGSDVDAFIRAIADLLAELNAIHPFREGNGRTQLVLVDLLGLRAAHPFDLARVRQATFLPAMIESFAGRVQPLRAELAEMLI